MKKFNQRLNYRPAPIPFTREKYELMQAEVDKLTLTRVDVLKRLQSAREMGDLSENGAYKYAKFELGSINRQLRDLNYKLRFGVVKQNTHSGVVEFGSRVKLVGKQGTMEFVLVSKHESNPSENKLSEESPIGKAVLGKRAGDFVEVATPSGVIQYQLVSVE